MRFSIVAGTDVGLRKSVNQDCYLAKTAHTDLGNVCMALICDGMGGLEEGERASQTVVGIFNEWFTNDFRNTPCLDNLDTVVEKLLLKANNTLMDYGKQKHIKLGTTSSIIIFIDEIYFTYHVGDTRIYKYSDKLIQLTQDHTLVAAKVKNGQLTKEEAKLSQEKNILLQCIGASTFMEIHRTEGHCLQGDAFLLCCDGLYNMLEDVEIAHVLKNQKSADENLMQNEINFLINTVKDRGETDNISGLLIKLR